MVDRCSIWCSRARSSFSEQLWFCNVFSSSAIRAPSLTAWALRWAPLTPGLTWAGAAGVGEDGVTAGGWAAGEGESGAEYDWESGESWNKWEEDWVYLFANNISCNIITLVVLINMQVLTQWEK